jgi:hypothetical protein
MVCDRTIRQPGYTNKHVGNCVADRAVSRYEIAPGLPHFSPTVRIPIDYFAGLTAPTVPVKLLKLRTESNLGAEGRNNQLANQVLVWTRNYAWSART